MPAAISSPDSTAEERPARPQALLIVSATQRIACSKCIPPTKLFVYSLEDPQKPVLVASGALQDAQGRQFEAWLMRTDSQGNVFMRGGFLEYLEPSLWDDKPAIAMVPRQSLLSLDSFSTFDHGNPFDLAVDERHARMVVTACGFGATMLSYQDDELAPLTGDLPLPDPQCVFSHLEAVTFSADGGTLYLLNGDLYKADVTTGGNLGAFQHLAHVSPSDGRFYITPELFLDARRSRFIVNLVDASSANWISQFRLVDVKANTNELLFSTQPGWDTTAAGVLTPAGNRLVALESGNSGGTTRCILHVFNLESQMVQDVQSGAFSECTRAIAVDQSGRFAYASSHGRLGVFALEGDPFRRAEPVSVVPFEEGLDYDVRSVATTPARRAIGTRSLPALSE